MKTHMAPRTSHVVSRTAPWAEKKKPPILKTVWVSLGFFLFTVVFAQADPGFLWLEPTSAMQRMGGNEAPSAAASPEKPGLPGSPHGSDPAAASGPPHFSSHARGETKPDAPKNAEKKEREKRKAMSNPVHYTLRTGWPPGASSSPSFLLHAHATILRPDGTCDVLTPADENGFIRIRDAALVQGRYFTSVCAETLEHQTRYRLFSRAIMRNAGEARKTRLNLEQADPDDVAPYFALLDETPDDETNFARIKRKYTGDTLPLKAVLDGKPVPDLDVTLISAQGWRQCLKTDEKGRVVFTLIKERFHDAGAVKTPGVYFALAELGRSLPEGEENPARQEVLRTAISFSVYPTPLDWETRAAGFYTVISVMSAIGLATAIRRRKRKRL